MQITHSPIGDIIAENAIDHTKDCENKQIICILKKKGFQGLWAGLT